MEIEIEPPHSGSVESPIEGRVSICCGSGIATICLMCVAFKLVLAANLASKTAACGSKSLSSLRLKSPSLRSKGRDLIQIVPQIRCLRETTHTYRHREFTHRHSCLQAGERLRQLSGRQVLCFAQPRGEQAELYALRGLFCELSCERRREMTLRRVHHYSATATDFASNFARRRRT